MRPFPRTRRRRLVAALAAVPLALGAVAVPGAQADDLKDRQRKVEKKIDDAREDLQESSARTRRAARALQRSRTRLREARGHLERVEADLQAAEVRDQQAADALAAAEERLDRARADVERGKEDVEVQRRAVEDMVVSIYREGDPDLLAFEALMNAETPSELASEQTVRDAVVDDQTHTYDSLRAATVLLGVREREVESARDEVQVRREQAAAHLAEVEDLRTDAVAARDDVLALVVSDREVRRRASAARAADQRALARLRAQETKIQRELRARALAALRRARARQAANARQAAPDGFLSYPVNGYVTSPFGYRTHPIYGYYGLHDGTDFGAGGCGAPLLAAANGRVFDTHYSSVYGNRLYLGHGVQRGKGLTSVYNHASRYTVSEGQYVTRGQVIGYMGATGWSTGCHLHFSVLANGRPVNPMNWF